MKQETLTKYMREGLTQLSKWQPCSELPIKRPGEHGTPAQPKLVIGATDQAQCSEGLWSKLSCNVLNSVLEGFTLPEIIRTMAVCKDSRATTEPTPRGLPWLMLTAPND
ncbi:hypothetical protein AMTRI_Chr08g208810 [Amborella trichopoda]